MTGLTPVHVGLVGHIDHGKTSLARVLSTKVSTAGLDKHPQAQERGITIDLGFTMFTMEDYLVTLVDAPGHADLIRSVVAGAGIIDAAILVVAADEGPKVQTGEHIIVLEAMGVESVLVAITKTDSATAAAVHAVENRMRAIMAETSFKTVEYARVSAVTGDGIDSLKAKLLTILRPKRRDPAAPLLIPIDHAFLVRGHGTVMTGTVLQGRLRTGDTVELMPQGAVARVRSIQTFGTEREEASAGDRVGVNVPEIHHETVHRGDYLCSPGSMSLSDSLTVDLYVSPLYRGSITKRMVLTATVGIPTVTAELVPLEATERGWVVLDRAEGPNITAALLLAERLPVPVGSRVLLMRSDLPPTQMRVVGSGQVTATHDTLRLLQKHVRVGRVQRVRATDVLVEGLATRRESAELLINRVVHTPAGVQGRLVEAFGTKGVMVAVFDSMPTTGTDVLYETYTEEEYRFGRRD
ncbi:MAG: selenocysteine-specific translation elongation factor [Candidatus Thorarchaeota archaeon]|nr:selenocysteine-specific translation elongation factor [Candidatus Thorarchaeota archaeon]